MRFKIVSIKGNSVRVKSGIVTFDVEVIDNNGKLTIKPDAWIADSADFIALSGAVKGEYLKNKTSVGVTNDNDKTEAIYNGK